MSIFNLFRRGRKSRRTPTSTSGAMVGTLTSRSDVDELLRSLPRTERTELVIAGLGADGALSPAALDRLEALRKLEEEDYERGGDRR